MIDFNKAKDIAINFAKSKGFNAIESCETENFYIFIPIGNNGEAIGMSASIAISKANGKAELKHYTELLKETIIKDY